MCGSIVDIQCATAEITRGKWKEERRKKRQQDGNITSASATQEGHNALSHDTMLELWADKDTFIDRQVWKWTHSKTLNKYTAGIGIYRPIQPHSSYCSVSAQLLSPDNELHPRNEFVVELHTNSDLQGNRREVRTDIHTLVADSSS